VTVYKPCHSNGPSEAEAEVETETEAEDNAEKWTLDSDFVG